MAPVKKKARLAKAKAEVIVKLPQSTTSIRKSPRLANTANKLTREVKVIRKSQLTSKEMQK